MRTIVLLLGLTLVAAAPAPTDEESFVNPQNGARYFNCKDVSNDTPARRVVVVDGLAICRIQAACDVELGGQSRGQVVKGAYTRASCAPDSCLTKSIYKCFGEKVPTKAD